MILFLVSISMMFSGLILVLLAMNYKYEDIHDMLLVMICMLCGSLLFLFGISNMLRL